MMDSQRFTARGMSEDGTPLGVYAKVGISFDEAEDVAAADSAALDVSRASATSNASDDRSESLVWRLREAIASGHAHAELSVHFDDEEIHFSNPNIAIDIAVAEESRSSENTFDDAADVVPKPSSASLASVDLSADIQRRADEVKKSETSGAGAQAVGSVVRRAVVAMRSKALDAEQRFRAVVVSLDSVPGNQVEGISPLYHIMGVDTADAEASVIQLTTKLTPSGLAELLDSLSAAHEGAVTLRLIDMEGATEGKDRDIEGTASVQLPLQAAKHEAEVLAPWLDMDPDAKFDGDPVSFLLAMAPDAARVGMLSDSWILGDTQ